MDARHRIFIGRAARCGHFYSFLCGAIFARIGGESGYWMTPLALASGIGAWLGGAVTDKRAGLLRGCIRRHRLCRIQPVSVMGDG